MSINVKEKADGEYVYSFSAERTAKKEGYPTQRTLHAVVNSGNESAANGISSTDNIRNQIETVKQKIQTVLDSVFYNHAAQMESYSVLPAKARDYVRTAERDLLEFMGQALSVPRAAQREFLAPIVRAITNE